MWRKVIMRKMLKIWRKLPLSAIKYGAKSKLAAEYVAECQISPLHSGMASHFKKAALRASL
jgi:hypothetical protein